MQLVASQADVPTSIQASAPTPMDVQPDVSSAHHLHAKATEIDKMEDMEDMEDTEDTEDTNTNIPKHITPKLTPSQIEAEKLLLGGKIAALKKFYWDDFEVTDLMDIKTLYDLITNKKIPLLTDNSKAYMYFYLAWYYDIQFEARGECLTCAEEKKRCTECSELFALIKKNHTISAEKGIVTSLRFMAILHQSVKDFTTMKQYYLQAIQKGDKRSMRNLGKYYYYNKDYDNMKKYLLMSIDEDISACILGMYYYHQKDKATCTKYYMMAINKDPPSITAMYEYGMICKTWGDRVTMKLYLTMASDRGDSESTIKLIEHYGDSGDLDRVPKLLEKLTAKLDTEMDEDVLMTVAHYYCQLDDYVNAYKYCQMGIDNKFYKAAVVLGEYCQRLGDKDGMMKQYKLALDKGVHDAYISLAKYYQSIRDYENMKKNALLAAEKGVKTGLGDLIDYLGEMGDLESMLALCKIGSEHKVTECILKLGEYYRDEGDTANMTKYYFMGVDANCPRSMFRLAQHYQSKRDYGNMMKFCLQGAKLKSDECVGMINDFVEGRGREKYAFMCKEYLNKRNLSILNKFINENWWITTAVKQERIECCSCLGEAPPAYNVCGCTRISYCSECYLTLDNCPFCRQSFKDVVGGASSGYESE